MPVASNWYVLMSILCIGANGPRFCWDGSRFFSPVTLKKISIVVHVLTGCGNTGTYLFIFSLLVFLYTLTHDQLRISRTNGIA